MYQEHRHYQVGRIVATFEGTEPPTAEQIEALENLSELAYKTPIIMEERYVYRRWRGNGQIIPDVMKSHYKDYPKHRRKPFKLSEVIVEEITKEEYLKAKSER